MAHEISNQADLLAAAIEGEVQRIRELLEEGVCVNSKFTVHGWTALMMSAENGHTNCANYLIKAGADVNLLAAANVNERDYSGKTALFYARYDNIVKILVAAGADVNAKDLNNGTALCEALFDCRRNVDVVKTLVQAGADVNFRGNDGKTAYLALMKFCYMLDDALLNLRAFLPAGLKINVFDYTVGDFTYYISGYGDIKRKVLDLLFAAGEEDPKYENFPDYLPPENEINLKHLCRKVIRSHLLKLDPHTHLFSRVPRLGLPSIISDNLLYHQALDCVW